LIRFQALHSALKLMMNSPDVGILGPSGHLVPMTYYYGSNRANVEIIANKLGISKKKCTKINFIAGSMYFMRKSILNSLNSLNFADSDFEIEAGQTDGTMAHAIERAVSLCALKEGYVVTSVDKSAIENYSYVN
jgi:lipopolysaccharide biosynthesis protein